MTLTKTTLRMNNLFLLGASVLVLGACLPEDEVGDQVNMSQQLESLASNYAQSFAQYSNIASNAVVNSEVWAAQTLEEGVIDLTGIEFGSLNLDSAEAFLQSAYCQIDGEDYHITWFDNANADNNLVLQGMGTNAAGFVNTKASALVADDVFGIAKDGAIEMKTGQTLTLSGNCTSITLPQNSAIAAIKIAAPIELAETQQKEITRAVSCPADEEGNIIQSISATYYPESGQIDASGVFHTSEADVIADNGLSWTTVSNGCVPVIASNVKTVSDQSVDALNFANISLPGEIAATLEGNLQDIDCKDVVTTSAEDTEDTEDNDDTIPNEEKPDDFDTCGTGAEIELLDGVEVTENQLKRTEEEVITAACIGDPSGSSTVTLFDSLGNSAGLPSNLSGGSATLTTGTFTGTSTYKKITRFYEIIEDFGSQKGRGGSSSEGNCENCPDEFTKVTFEGLTLECSANDTLSVPCAQFYNPGGSLQSDRPALYTRSRSISGWDNAENPNALEPNDPEFTPWVQTQSMQCVWRETEISETGCLRITNEREYTATSPDNGEWGGWTIASRDDSGCDDGSFRIGNGDSGASFGGDACLVAGTRVVMADGSIKKVEDIQIGDHTAGGRVLQKYTRNYDKFLTWTSNGMKRINGGGGLVEYDGIIATDRHPFYLDGQWYELGDYPKAVRVDESDDIMIVYNFLTEDHIVPVIGKSGRIYNTADDLNNIFESAEKGRLKQLYLHKKIKYA